MKKGEESGTIHKIISIAILSSLGLLIPWSADTKLTLLILRPAPLLIAPILMIWSPRSVRQYFSSQATDRDVRCWGTLGLFVIAIPCWLILPGLAPS